MHIRTQISVQFHRACCPHRILASSLAERVPPHGYFLVSAVFHYLGPAFAVLLFAHIAPLGVAWLRIASAALIFALWRRPWRYFGALSVADRWAVVALAAVLAAMNCCFYEAIARLPLGTVGAIEFLGPIALGGRRPAHAAQSRGADRRGGRRLPADRHPHRRRARGLSVRLRELRAVRRLHHARPPHRRQMAARPASTGSPPRC